MRTSENGIALIKKFEGCCLTAYKDCVGVLTIGYGITNADKNIIGVTIKQGMKIDRDTADKWLRLSIANKYEEKVAKYDQIYHFNQNQWDALVSFAFNIGSIDQLTANGTRSIEMIAKKMLAYCKAGGKTVKGLLERRKKEQALFLTPVVENETPAVKTKKEEVRHDMDTLRKGDKGQQVKCLQMALNIVCGANVKTDGDFGTKTENAVIAFQKAKKMTADGIVGQKTWKALLGED